MKTIEWNVEGMMCGHCENRVQTALGNVAGINACKASASDNKVTCTFDENIVTEATIKEAIEDAGYDVVA